METAQREYRALLMADPNLRWADYLALSPEQRGPQKRSGFAGSQPAGGPMYGNGKASTEELYRALMARPPQPDMVPMGAAIEAMNRAIQEREETTRYLQDQLAEVSAERDQLKAVIAGPAWGSMEAEGAEYGPFAALAQARGILVEAYQLREHALTSCHNADNALVDLEREQADLAREHQSITLEGEGYRREEARTNALRADLDRREKLLDQMWLRARLLNGAAVLMNLIWLALFALGAWDTWGDWHWEAWWPWA
jgi:hypothetical protein